MINYHLQAVPANLSNLIRLSTKLNGSTWAWRAWTHATPEHTTKDDEEESPALKGTLPETKNLIPKLNVGSLAEAAAAWYPAHMYFK